MVSFYFIFHDKKSPWNWKQESDNISLLLALYKEIREFYWLAIQKRTSPASYSVSDGVTLWQCDGIMACVTEVSY